MGEKYFSEVDGYKECFIEVSDNWTMREVRELTDGNEEVYFDYFRKKVDTMLLKDADGKELTNPREVTVEILENCNVSLVGFFGSILSLHIRRLKSLGGMNVRASSLTTDLQTQTKKT